MTHAIPEVILTGLAEDLERDLRAELSARYPLHSAASMDALAHDPRQKRILVLSLPVRGKARPEGLCRHVREQFPNDAVLVLCSKGADLRGLADLGLVEAAARSAAPGEILLRVSGLAEQLEGQLSTRGAEDEEGHPDLLDGNAFLRRAHAEADRIRRHGGTLALLAITASGDAIPKAEQMCLATLRESDVIGHVSAEVIAVLLPETGADIAVEVAGRVRDAYGTGSATNGNTIRFAVTAISVFDEDHGIVGAMDAACSALAGEPADGVRVL